MKTCPNCGQENWDTAPTCSKCGAWLSQTTQNPGPSPQNAPPPANSAIPPKQSEFSRALSWGFGLGCGYLTALFCFSCLVLGGCGFFLFSTLWGTSKYVEEQIHKTSIPASQAVPHVQPLSRPVAKPRSQIDRKPQSGPQQEKASPGAIVPAQPIPQKETAELAPPVKAYLQHHAEHGDVVDADPAEANQQRVTLRDGKYLFKFQEERITGVHRE